MSRKAVQKTGQSRRSFTEEFKREAVAMLLDGHSAPSVAERLGLSNPSLLSRWKSAQMEQSGPVGASLEAQELEVVLARVTRERDILKRRWSFSATANDRRVRGRGGDCANQ